MKLISVLAVTATLSLATAAPAQAQLLGSSTSGLLGLANNLLNVQTGNISVLDGGILNGANVLSGIGLNSSASTSVGSSWVSGFGHQIGNSFPTHNHVHNYPSKWRR